MSHQGYEAVSDPILTHQPLDGKTWTLATNCDQVNAHDEDERQSSVTQPPSRLQRIPSSPPPSFRSRASSPTARRLLAQDPLAHDADQDLVDTFDDGEESDAENDGDDRQRLMMRTNNGVAQANEVTAAPASDDAQHEPVIERRVTELPAFQPSSRAPQRATDGVFANLSAKPERGEQVEEKPPVSGGLLFFW